jgi:hypothetical protein
VLCKFLSFINNLKNTSKGWSIIQLTLHLVNNTEQQASPFYWKYILPSFLKDLLNNFFLLLMIRSLRYANFSFKILGHISVIDFRIIYLRNGLISALHQHKGLLWELSEVLSAYNILTINPGPSSKGLIHELLGFLASELLGVFFLLRQFTFPSLFSFIFHHP